MSKPVNRSPDRLKIEYIAVKDIKPNPKNPRKHSKKQISQLANCVSQFGFTVPLLLNKEAQIIAGHGRLEAALQNGMKEVPVIRLEHLSEAQARAYMIADNKLTENAEWDTVLLGEHFKELVILLPDISLDITGFELPEIDIMIQGLGDDTESEEAPIIIDETAPTVTKPGDLWVLDNHRILCGDALVTASYLLLMGEQKAQMVFTDPPYNVRIQGHVSGLGKAQHEEFAMASGEMSSEEFADFLETTVSHLIHYSIDGSVHFICMDWRHIGELLAGASELYPDCMNMCIWNKNNAGMGSLYRSKHELVFVFKNGSAPHINNVELGKHGRYRTNVWDYPGQSSLHGQRDKELAMHPTVKPLAMVSDAILDCSHRGGLVLDPFGGSGTTLIAAEKTGRQARLMEIEPRYVDVTIRRWQEQTGKEAIHAKSGKSFNQLNKQATPAKEVRHV